ncbi:unnamed protein product, partial [Gongylonema pulchrum]|uniref:Uncharacterized protein n=1 Tax=Gongylonema pulchrum TaxID=637853 RepID=A0A183DIT9_9BILA
MPHLHHQHRLLLQSEISKHRLRERFQVVVMNDYDNADQWYLEYDEAPELSPDGSSETPQESAPIPRSSLRRSRKLIHAPTYYYPTSYPDAPNYPIKLCGANHNSHQHHHEN